MTKNQQIGLVAGGALIAGGIVAVVAKKAMAAAKPTPSPSPTPETSAPVYTNVSPVAQFDPGQSYFVMGPTNPPGSTPITSKASLLNVLGATNMWTNLNVLYFGQDTIANWPPEMPYPSDISQMNGLYVFFGTYTGQSSYPVTSGLVVVKVTAPVSIPSAAPVVSAYGGTNILTVSYGGALYVGNTTCHSPNPPLTLLGQQQQSLAGTQVALGLSQNEVVNKLKSWLDKNCQ